MEKTTRFLVTLSLFTFMLLILSACGGGGGDGAPPAIVPPPVTDPAVPPPEPPPEPPLAPLSVSGSVTDSDRAPVNGATVTIYNSTGTAVTSVYSNAAGLYEVRGLPSGLYTLSASGPLGTFPTELFNLDLTSGSAPTVDIYLPSTSAATETPPGSLVYMQDDMANIAMHTELDLSASTLIGTLTGVNLKPINVREFGTGEAAEVFSLAVDPADYITIWHASAAFELIGASLDTSGLAAILQLPVATVAQPFVPDTAPLYRLDVASMTWLQVDADPSTTMVTDDATLDSSDAFYTADLFAGGLYRVGEVSSDTVAITGRVTYDNGSSIPGATVYINGTDYGYQQVVTTASGGTFSGHILGNAGLPKYAVTACKKQGGVQICTVSNLDQDTSSVTVDLGDFMLPLTAGASTVTLTVGDGTNIGINAASGRIYTAASDVSNYADVGIGVSTFGDADGYVQVFSPEAPAGTVNGGVDPVTVNAPQTVLVQTAAGHTASITVTSIVDNGNTMDVTFSIAFTL